MDPRAVALLSCPVCSGALAVAVGGLACPALIALAASGGATSGLALLGVLALVLCVGGELLERLTFFSAMSAPKMPGALR
jgi:hypothetical protein